jgi:cold shock CspA family protein
MRIDGTLTKWNDDRGFGFITPAQGGAQVFAHISAFPRDGQRPRLGERVTFEIGTGKDGKQQAMNIACPSRATAKPYRLREPARRSKEPGLLGRLIPIGLVVALGVYAYDVYTQRTAPQTAFESPSVETTAPSHFRCDGRTHCSQMTSCAEAEFFLANCPGVEMDGNHDGEPCEQQWCQ